VTFNVNAFWMVGALCSIGFGLLVLIVRKNYTNYLGRVLTYWGLAYVCYGIAFTIWFERDLLGQFLFSVVSRTLVAVGFSMAYRAATELKQRRFVIPWLVIPPVLTFAMCTWFTYVQRNITIELMLFNVIALVMMVRMAVTMFSSEGGERPFVDVVAASSYGLFALSTSIVIVNFLRTSHFTREYDFNSGRTIYNAIAAIVAEGVLYSLFLLAVAERLNRDLKKQAMHDPLTDLYNRRAFREIAFHELSGATRTGIPLSILMVDIDHFKVINDSHGHAAGDFIIKAAANMLLRSLRDEDYLCRWGGDEFCALLPRATLEQAQGVAARAVRAFEATDVGLGEQAVRVSISVGIMTQNDPAMEFDALVKSADEALYRAKRLGRNRFVCA
jgi:diguanylate cyclase (GGDEF)-like protein